MAKEDIFSKMNIKDYNNALEKVVEKKDFSEDVKNLLLNMLYRIETGYADYAKVKQNVDSKKRFVERIIRIVEEDCKKIQLVKSMSEESKALEGAEFLVDQENGKIVVYQNERMLLEALLALKQQPVEIEEDYQFLQEAMNQFIVEGNRMNFVEVLRDFNGWSWDILTKEMDSLPYNLIYQNMVILLGNHFMQKWGRKEEIWQEEVEEEEFNESPINTILSNKEFDHIYEEEPKIDVIEKLQYALKENYGEALEKKWEKQFYQAILILISNQNELEREKILEEKKRLEDTLGQMQDKRKYIESQSDRKKTLAMKIKEIDKLMNDTALLKEEYRNRNSKLANKDKIFSISHLADRLEKERSKLLEEIQEINKSIEPTTFVKRKEEIQKQVEFFEEMKIQEGKKKTDELSCLLNLQKIFLECFMHKIEKIENKKQMISLLYTFRYYLWIPLEEGYIKDRREIKEEIDMAIEKLIQKACQMKVLTMLSEQVDFNINVLSNILDNKIITLETIIYILKYQKEVLKIEIYDDTIHEKDVSIPIKKKTELSVKLNKKIKLFS